RTCRRVPVFHLADDHDGSLDRFPARTPRFPSEPCRRRSTRMEAVCLYLTMARIDAGRSRDADGDAVPLYGPHPGMGFSGTRWYGVDVYGFVLGPSARMGSRDCRPYSLSVD